MQHHKALANHWILLTHGWRWDYQALRAGRPLPIGRILMFISVRGWVDPRVIVRLEGRCKLKKKSDDLIGNRTRDLPVCNSASTSSIYTQPVIESVVVRLGLISHNTHATHKDYGPTLWDTLAHRWQLTRRQKQTKHSSFSTTQF
jgi:hypothetical protein